MRRGVIAGAALGLVLAAIAAPAAEAKDSNPRQPSVDIQPGLTISILGVGDILTHRQIIDQAIADASGGDRIDFYPQLKGIARLVSSADLAICHMEYPMGSHKGPWTAWPGVPDAPPQLAEAIAEVGFDACSTASNHTLDQGFPGIERLLNALDDNGIAHEGTARTKKESETPTIVEVKGVKVGLLSYAYGFDGMPKPPGYEWCANVVNVERMIAEARLARKMGARLVVLSLHDGDEGIVHPSGEQMYVVQKLAESKQIDLVLGHHVHVVQPVDRVDGMWVAYGHGNLLTAQDRKNPRSGDGLISEFTFTEQADGSFEPTRAVGYVVHNYDYPFRLSLVPGKDQQDWAEAGSWQRTSGAVSGFGARDKGFRLLRWGGD